MNPHTWNAGPAWDLMGSSLSSLGGVMEHAAPGLHGDNGAAVCFRFGNCGYGIAVNSCHLSLQGWTGLLLLA